MEEENEINSKEALQEMIHGNVVYALGTFYKISGDNFLTCREGTVDWTRDRDQTITQFLGRIHSFIVTPKPMDYMEALETEANEKGIGRKFQVRRVEWKAHHYLIGAKVAYQDPEGVNGLCEALTLTDKAACDWQLINVCAR